MLASKSFLTLIICLFFASCVNAEAILQGIDGKKIPFGSLNGKWVLINYWASWCQPCLDEIPELNRFYEQTKSANVTLFAVNYDALPEHEQKALVKAYDIHYPALVNDPATSLRLGDIRGVPVTFVFNPQGQLTEKLYGGQTVKSLIKAIALNRP